MHASDIIVFSFIFGCILFVLSLIMLMRIRSDLHLFVQQCVRRIFYPYSAFGLLLIIIPLLFFVIQHIFAMSSRSLFFFQKWPDWLSFLHSFLDIRLRETRKENELRFSETWTAHREKNASMDFIPFRFSSKYKKATFLQPVRFFPHRLPIYARW